MSPMLVNQEKDVLGTKKSHEEALKKCNEDISQLQENQENVVMDIEKFEEHCQKKLDHLRHAQESTDFEAHMSMIEEAEISGPDLILEANENSELMQKAPKFK